MTLKIKRKSSSKTFRLTEKKIIKASFLKSVDIAFRQIIKKI